MIAAGPCLPLSTVSSRPAWQAADCGEPHACARAVCAVRHADTCHGWARYTDLGKRFLGHLTVEHSKELSGPKGENNNQAEELNWRYDRAEKGVYLTLS